MHGGASVLHDSENSSGFVRELSRGIALAEQMGGSGSAATSTAASLPHSYFVGLLWSSLARRPISISLSSLWDLLNRLTGVNEPTTPGNPRGARGTSAEPCFCVVVRMEGG